MNTGVLRTVREGRVGDILHSCTVGSDGVFSLASGTHLSQGWEFNPNGLCSLSLCPLSGSCPPSALLPEHLVQEAEAGSSRLSPYLCVPASTCFLLALLSLPGVSWKGAQFFFFFLFSVFANIFINSLRNSYHFFRAYPTLIPSSLDPPISCHANFEITIFFSSFSTKYRFCYPASLGPAVVCSEPARLTTWKEASSSSYQMLTAPW